MVIIRFSHRKFHVDCSNRIGFNSINVEFGISVKCQEVHCSLLGFRADSFRISKHSCIIKVKSLRMDIP